MRITVRNPNLVVPSDGDNRQLFVETSSPRWRLSDLDIDVELQLLTARVRRRLWNLHGLNPDTLRDAIYDSVVDALLQIERKRPQRLGETEEECYNALRAWVTQSAVWFAKERLSRLRRYAVLDFDPQANGNLDSLSTAEWACVKKEWVTSLHTKNRMVLQMRLEGYTVKEIAQAIRASQSTVFRRWKAITNQLKRSSGMDID